MNEKLKAWQGKLSELRPRPIGKGSGYKRDTLVSLYPCTDEHSKVDIIRASLHERVLELTGWKDGDHMDAVIEGNQMVMYRAERGPTLCRVDTRKNGSCSRRYVRFPLPYGSAEGFPRGEAQKVEAGPGRLAFNLPASSEE